jgi:hypothetical protein
MPRQIIPFPQELRPRLPTIVGNVDYRMLRTRLEQIDALLRESGLETEFVQLALDRWTLASSRGPSAIEQHAYQQRSRRALRCNLLRTLLTEDFRGFSCQLAGNPLYQWFCNVDAMDVVRVPSKSELQRFSKWLPANQMRPLMDRLLQGALANHTGLGLTEALDLEEYFLDTTALKANVHFPTDWVLLRDGIRTLMKATLLIRREGLRGRMESPEEFLRRSNCLCIEMVQGGRREGGRKARKKTLRQIKKLVSVVKAHARRHRDLLDQQWQKTSWTRRQAEQVLRRIDGVLTLLPKAQEQAHERIIGERSVPSREKILSLYDTDVRVLVRGKAGAEVEFGNTLLVGENRQGIILDFELFREHAPADSQLLFRSLTQVMEVTGRQVGSVTTDRGFTSDANSKALAESGTQDATCPRRPAELKERMGDESFARRQRRRGQTEARIGILKHGFLGSPMRAKGFEHRQLALVWGVLTHNLWKLAALRTVAARRKRRPEPGKRAA